MGFSSILRNFHHDQYSLYTFLGYVANYIILYPWEKPEKKSNYNIPGNKNGVGVSVHLESARSSLVK